VSVTTEMTEVEIIAEETIEIEISQSIFKIN
jgi:hypothetical protein